MALWWEDCPPYFYVRGHVPAGQARKTVAAAEVDFEAAGQRVRHRYMRWSWPDTASRSDGLDFVAVLYDRPGRGRFKVTEVEAAEN